MTRCTNCGHPAEGPVEHHEDRDAGFVEERRLCGDCARMARDLMRDARPARSLRERRRL